MSGQLETTRKRLGLPRAAVAARLGISERQVYRLERGVTRPKRLHLLALAEIYGCSVEDLEERP
jgi:transcriptional regulator with XRE-family HTH domain